jgi:hypothetical protein
LKSVTDLRKAVSSSALYQVIFWTTAEKDGGEMTEEDNGAWRPSSMVKVKFKWICQYSENGGMTAVADMK